MSLFEKVFAVSMTCLRPLYVGLSYESYLQKSNRSQPYWDSGGCLVSYDRCGLLRLPLQLQVTPSDTARLLFRGQQVR
jgi:hypothetical protein